MTDNVLEESENSESCTDSDVAAVSLASAFVQAIPGSDFSVISRSILEYSSAYGVAAATGRNASASALMKAVVERFNSSASEIAQQVAKNAEMATSQLVKKTAAATSPIAQIMANGSTASSTLAGLDFSLVIPSPLSKSIAELGILQSSFASVSGALKTSVSSLISEAVHPHVGALRDALSKLASFPTPLLPENFFALSADERDQAFNILLNEGLCFSWVIPVAAIRFFLTAESAEARLELLVEHQDVLIERCRDLADEAASDAVRGEYADFLEKSISAFEDGHIESAQALSTALFDSMLRDYFTQPSYRQLTQRKRASDWVFGKLTIAGMLIAAGIHGSHQTYNASAGEEVPTRYNRHAVTHGVSKRQYTRPNAISAIMHASALLRASRDTREVIEEIEAVLDEEANRVVHEKRLAQARTQK